MLVELCVASLIIFGLSLAGCASGRLIAYIYVCQYVCAWFHLSSSSGAKIVYTICVSCVSVGWTYMHICLVSRYLKKYVFGLASVTARYWNQSQVYGTALNWTWNKRRSKRRRNATCRFERLKNIVRQIYYVFMPFRIAC